MGDESKRLIKKITEVRYPGVAKGQQLAQDERDEGRPRVAGVAGRAGVLAQHRGHVGLQQALDRRPHILTRLVLEDAEENTEGDIWV